MSDLSSVYMALQKADAAGDTQGAKVLADYIRTQSAGDTAKTPMEQLDQINGAQKPEADPSDNASLIDKNLAVLNTARGVIQNGMVAPIANVVGALMPGGTGEENAARLMGRFGHQPGSPLEAQYTQNVGKVFDSSKLAGLPVVGNELGMLAQGVKDIRVPPGIVKRGLNAITPAIDPNTATLASKFTDIGGTVPLHSLTSNKFVRMAGEGMDNLPLSGGTKQANKLAINQELIRQIGGTANPDEMLTPANFAPAMEKSGNAIGELYGKTPVPMDETLQSELNSLASAQRKQSKDVRNIVKAYIEDIKTMGESGIIPGDALRAQDSALGTRIRSLAPGDLRGQLSDLQETLRDALKRNLSQEDADALHVFRKQYAIGKQLEPLVAKSAFEGVSPQALMGKEISTAAGKHRMAMNAAGEMGDLANIGQKFTKEQGSSGTTERGLIVGALMDTGKAIAGLGMGNIYNRIGPYIANRIIAKSLPEIKSTLPTANEIADQGLSLVPFEPSGAGYQGPNQSLGLVPRGTPTPTGASDVMRAPSAPDLELGPGGSRRPELDIQGIKDSLGVQRAFDVAHAQADRKSGGIGLNLSDVRAGGTASQAGTQALSPQNFTFYNAEIKGGSMTKGERVEVVNPEQTGMITDPFGNEVPSVMARFVDRKGSPQFVVPQNLLSTLSRPHSPRFAQDIAETVYGPPSGIGLSAAQPKPRVAGQRISPAGIGLSKP